MDGANGGSDPNLFPFSSFHQQHQDFAECCCSILATPWLTTVVPYNRSSFMLHSLPGTFNLIMQLHRVSSRSCLSSSSHGSLHDKSTRKSKNYPESLQTDLSPLVLLQQGSAPERWMSGCCMRYLVRTNVFSAFGTKSR